MKVERAERRAAEFEADLQADAAIKIQAMQRRRHDAKLVQEKREATKRAGGTGEGAATEDPESFAYSIGGLSGSSGSTVAAGSAAAIARRQRGGGVMRGTGQGLTDVFFHAVSDLLEKESLPEKKLWGVRLLHAVSNEIAHRDPERFPKLLPSRWVHGPLGPVMPGVAATTQALLKPKSGLGGAPAPGAAKDDPPPLPLPGKSPRLAPLGTSPRPIDASAVPAQPGAKATDKASPESASAKGRHALAPLPERTVKKA